MKHIRRTAGFLAVLGVVLLLSMGGLGVAAASSGDSTATEVDVSLDPANETVAPGEAAAYDIVVTGATDGIGAYKMTVELTDPSVATVEGFDHAYEPQFDNTVVRDDRVNVSAAMGDNIIDGADELVLGTVTVAGESDGETGVAFDGGAAGVELANETDGKYDVTAAADGTLTVAVPEIDVGLAPADQTVGVDGQRSYDIVVEGATGGVGAYKMTVELADSSVATVEGFDHAHQPEFDNTVVQDDRVNVSAAMGDNGIAAGEEVILGTVTVNGSAAGTTDLAFDTATVEVALDDEAVSSYETGNVTDGTLEVVEQNATAGVELVPLDPVAIGEMQLGVVVTDANNGIGAYDMEIASNNSTVTFVDYQLTADGEPLDASDISDDGTGFSLAAALLNNVHEPAEEIQIATVTVAVDGPGAFALEFDEAAVQDIDGGEYVMSSENLDMSVSPIPPVGGGAPPQDLNGDGLHEDITGSGGVGVFDVQALFDNLGNSSIQDHAEKFNFGGSNASVVTIFDVQALFEMAADDA